MKNILWISRFVPYDSVPHAGGQIENYYLKGVKKSNCFNLELVSFAREDEKTKLDLDKYGIDNHIIEYPKGIYRYLWMIPNRIHKYISFKDGHYSNYYISKKIIKSLDSVLNNPDIIILQWTEIVLLIDQIKDRFPEAKIVCVEEDVSFLTYYRRYEKEENRVKKCLKHSRYTNLRNTELACLKRSDLVILNNYKDKKLIEEYGIDENVWVWTPYFQSFLDKNYVGGSKNLIIYGAMGRPENWEGAIWFIENVFNKLDDNDLTLYIVGNKPHPQLLSYKSDRVKITGFVDDVSEYLKNGMCLIVPLLMGAGVKIKVIEGLSAGIPVVTNDIGIEGINAIDKETYFHCESNDSFINTITDISSGRYDLRLMSNREKELVRKEYNMEKSLDEFISRLLHLLE